MKKVRKTFQNKESLERPIYKASQAFCLFQLSKTGLKQLQTREARLSAILCKSQCISQPV